MNEPEADSTSLHQRRRNLCAVCKKREVKILQVEQPAGGSERSMQKTHRCPQKPTHMYPIFCKSPHGLFGDLWPNDSYPSCRTKMKSKQFLISINLVSLSPSKTKYNTHIQFGCFCFLFHMTQNDWQIIIYSFWQLVLDADQNMLIFSEHLNVDNIKCSQSGWNHGVLLGA